jgi:23S rRNA (pseudouridine1915-N3)-methyltransferase
MRREITLICGMALMILAVGSMKDRAQRSLFDHYAEGIALKEVEEKRKVAGAELMRREAELLRAAMPKGAVIVALDRRGRTLSSEDLAQRLQRWQTHKKNVAFVIGGAEGLDEGLRNEADFILSFGPNTWPHMLARIMLAEQLYRAQAILAGHPYHRAE